MIGVQPALGRPFSERETVPGDADVVLLSDGVWLRRFGADPEIVGRTISLDNVAHTVVGVMPPGFSLPLDLAQGNVRDIWLPLAIDRAEAPRANRSTFAMRKTLRHIRQYWICWPTSLCGMTTISAGYSNSLRSPRRISAAVSLPKGNAKRPQNITPSAC